VGCPHAQQRGAGTTQRLIARSVKEPYGRLCIVPNSGDGRGGGNGGNRHNREGGKHRSHIRWREEGGAGANPSAAPRNGNGGPGAREKGSDERDHSKRYPPPLKWQLAHWLHINQGESAGRRRRESAGMTSSEALSRAGLASTEENLLPGNNNGLGSGAPLSGRVCK